MTTFLKQLLNNEQLLIGISELSSMSAISPRQLRYWEEKGWISSVPEEHRGARRYHLTAVVKVEMIRGYLDEGFTLKAAVEKAEKRIKKVLHIRQAINACIDDIEVVDQRFTVFSIAQFEQQDERLILVYDSQKEALHYRIFLPEEALSYADICEEL